MSEKATEGKKGGYPAWRWEPIARYTREEALERAKAYVRDIIIDEDGDSPYPSGEKDRILAALARVDSLPALLKWEGFGPGFLEEVTEAQRLQAIARALGISVEWDDQVDLERPGF